MPARNNESFLLIRFAMLAFCCLGIASAGQGVGAHKWVRAQGRRSFIV